MTTEQMVQIGFQLILTGFMGWLAYLIKRTIDKMDEKNKEQDAKISDIEKEFAALKADLPFIYTTREDYIRGMNNVDANIKSSMKTMEDKIDKIFDRVMKG